MRRYLLLLAFLVATPAQAEWWRAETDHFIIYSEDKQGPIKAFATELERFDNALRTLQAMPTRPTKELSESSKVTIFRIGRVSDIAILAGAPNSGIAGFYIPRAGSSVAFTPVREDRRDRSLNVLKSDRGDIDPRSILQHEYVHHFMLTNFPATYPDWYIEAFAELYATIELKPDGGFHVGNPPLYRVEQIYALPEIPLNEMFDQRHKRDDIDRIQFYGYGWLVAHYLNFSPKRKGQLVAYLKALDKGEDGLTAARRVFGDLAQLSSEVRQYRNEARAGKFPGFDFTPANYSPPTVTLRPLDAGETEVINSWMRSRRGVNRKQAIDIANDLAPKAQRHPNSAFVQIAAAEAFLDAKRYDEADAAADRALAINPNSTEALVFKGAIAIERGKAGDTARFAAARAPLKKAADLDPQDPRPFILYYESYRRAGGPIPEPALLALERAFKPAASDTSYRMLLARQLLSEGKADLAKTVLAPIAFRFHGNQSDNKMGSVVSLINQGKVREAFTRIDAVMKEAEEKAKKE